MFVEEKKVEFGISKQQIVMDTINYPQLADHVYGDSKDIKKSNEKSTIETNLKLHEDIFILFFLINYTKRYEQLSFAYKILWWFGIILTFFVQVASLYFVSISYSLSWEIDYDFEFDSTNIFFKNTLHSLCLCSSTFILYFYLLKSAIPFIDLYSFCICCRNSLTKVTYIYGVMISCLNLGIILMAWYASLLISLSGVYGTIDNPAEIVLASVSFLFILEVDDYICSLLLHNTEQTEKLQNDQANNKLKFSVKVNLKQFQKSSKYGKMFVSVLLISMFVFIIYTAADLFQNESLYSNDSNGVINKYLQWYSAMHAMMMVFAIRAIFKPKDLMKQRLVDKLVFFFCMIMIILLSCFGISFFDGTPNKMQNLQPEISISIAIGIINYVLLIEYMLMEFKEMCIKFKNIVFWIIIILCAMVIIMWRIKSGEQSESGIAIVPFGIVILYKFYLSDVSTGLL